MSKWIITIDVDEDNLRASAQESAEDGEIEEMTVEDMIYQEMGWVGQSGIHVESLEEMKQA